MGRPLLLFALLGIALFAVDRLWWSVEAPPPVVIPAQRVEGVLRELSRVLQRAPSVQEVAAALEREVEDEVLHREALARGYENGDPVVFRRLVQNLRFAGADPEREDAELYREALALGLHESDVVVRRRLIQRLRLELESASLGAPPREDELRALHAAQQERYRSPGRVRIAQFYFDRKREADAQRELEALRDARATPERASPDSDAFLHPREQPSQTHAELAARFGVDFADAVFAAEVGAWSGPIPSAYGSHLVWVHEREAARDLAFEEVRERVRYALLAERRRRSFERGLAQLREGVKVIVEDPGALAPEAGREG